MTEENPWQEVVDGMPDVKMAPAIGIGAIALTLAMKYHDIGTVQDGTLYQQYKLEGKAMIPLSIHMVFETAMQIEAHLLGSSDRIANMVVDAMLHGDPNAEAPEAEEETL